MADGAEGVVDALLDLVSPRNPEAVIFGSRTCYSSQRTTTNLSDGPCAKTKDPPRFVTYFKTEITPGFVHVRKRVVKRFGNESEYKDCERSMSKMVKRNMGSTTLSARNKHLEPMLNASECEYSVLRVFSLHCDEIGDVGAKL